MHEGLPANANLPDQKFGISFLPEQLHRFEPDHPESPIVGFLYDEVGDVQLIVLEHTHVVHASMITDGNQPAFIAKLPKDNPERLLFDPCEWVAFYGGIKEGQFDYSGMDSGYGYFCDNKDPRDVVLVHTPQGYTTFLDAVKAGKYDLGASQHQLVVEQLRATFINKGMPVPKGLIG